MDDGASLQPRDVPQQGSRWGSPPKREGWQFILQAYGLQEPAVHNLECPESSTAAAGVAYTDGNVCFFSYVWYAMLSRGLPCLPVAVPCDEFRNDSTSTNDTLEYLFPGMPARPTLCAPRYYSTFLLVPLTPLAFVAPDRGTTFGTDVKGDGHRSMNSRSLPSRQRVSHTLQMMK